MGNANGPGKRQCGHQPAAGVYIVKETLRVLRWYAPRLSSAPRMVPRMQPFQGWTKDAEVWQQSAHSLLN
eukprot:2758227-Prorocentrum_lima.AAC.1